MRLVSTFKEQRREPFSGNRAEKRSHNLGKALGERFGLLKN